MKAPCSQNEGHSEKLGAAAVVGRKTQRSTATGLASGQAKIYPMFRRNQTGPAGQGTTERSELRPWTFNIRLGNPHQLCAEATSIVHTVEDLNFAEMAGIVALCRCSAGSGSPLVLSRQLEVRSLPHRWNFGPSQRDVSEFLKSLLSERSEAWFKWEARQLRQGSIHIAD